MRVLITGGIGFVGSNLALYLAEKGHETVVYDNMQRNSHNLHPVKAAGCKIIQGELDDIQEHIRDENFDVAYHFAAQVAVTHSYHSPKSDFRINAAGTFHLVSSIKAPVIYASTNKVYGDNVNYIPIEELPTRYDFANEFKNKGIPEHFSIDSKKHTPYGCSKLVGELYVREYGGVVNRFSCMYGPNQFGNEDQGWVAHFVTSKVKGKQITIYGNGKQVRDLLYIGDVVKLLELEARNINKIKGEVFNIGGGYDKTLSLLELCDKLKLKYTFGNPRPADQKVYYSDISKAKKILGWAPKISVEDGIQRIGEWVEKNKDKFV